jgi:hypothetical protein
MPSSVVGLLAGLSPVIHESRHWKGEYKKDDFVPEERICILLKNSYGGSLRAQRSNPGCKKIKSFEIATSLTPLAMKSKIEFFSNLLEYENTFFLNSSL